MPYLPGAVSGSPPSGRGLRGQVPGQAVEHLGGAFLAEQRRLGPVDAVQVGALLGPGQRGAVRVLAEFNRGDRHRDPRVTRVHLVGVDDPLVWRDVVVAGVIAVSRALHLEAEALPPAGPEVELGDAGLAVGRLQVPDVAPGVL